MRSKYCLEKKNLHNKFYDWAALGDQSVTK